MKKRGNRSREFREHVVSNQLEGHDFSDGKTCLMFSE